MFLIHCPYCDEHRAEEEFHAAGQAHLTRPASPMDCSDAEWGHYLHFRDNPRGEHREMWVHAAGCRRHFNLARDTLTYEILGSYPIGGSLDEDARPAVPMAPTAGEVGGSNEGARGERRGRRGRAGGGDGGRDASAGAGLGSGTETSPGTGTGSSVRREDAANADGSPSGADAGAGTR